MPAHAHARDRPPFTLGNAAILGIDEWNQFLDQELLPLDLWIHRTVEIPGVEAANRHHDDVELVALFEQIVLVEIIKQALPIA